MQSWDLEKERNVKVLANTPSTKTTRRGDWLKSWLMIFWFLRAQHDVPKNATKTDVLRLSIRKREAN